MTKRLFVGVFIDKSTFGNKLELLQKEFDAYTIGKWVEDYNLHFTLKFIGDFEISQIPKLKEALSEHLATIDEVLTFKGLFVLPNEKTPRVLYIDIQTDTNILLEKAIIIDDICSDFGVAREKRQFKPHLTLLRMKSVSKGFPAMLRKYSDTFFGKTDKFTINLIESRLSSKGPSYIIIE
jgi:2'-5' RNA ligase